MLAQDLKTHLTMKGLMLYLLLMLTSSGLYAQKQHYLAATSSIDHFWLIVRGEKQEITPDKLDHTQFRFSTADPANTVIQLACMSCEDKLSLKLWGKMEDAYTRWIYLSDGEQISLAEAFEDYPEVNRLSSLYETIKERIVSFLQSSWVGRTTRGKSNAVRSGHQPSTDEPKLSFVEMDDISYPDEEDFRCRFKLYKGYPVKSIYLLSHDEEVMLSAGDQTTLKGFDVVGKPNPPVAEVLTLLDTEDGVKTYEMNFETIKPFLFRDFQPGQWYQLAMELEGDTFDDYLFNFRFMTPEHYELLENFARE